MASGTGRAYFAALRKHWIVMSTGVTASVIALVCGALRLELWVAAVGVAVVSLVAAQFLVWRDMRTERDAARQRASDLLASVHHSLVIKAFNGFIDFDDQRRVRALQLKFVFENDASIPIEFVLKHVQLFVAGSPRPPMSDDSIVHLRPRREYGQLFRTAIDPPRRENLSGTGTFTFHYWGAGGLQRYEWLHNFRWRTVKLANNETHYEHAQEPGCHDVPIGDSPGLGTATDLP